MKTLIKISFVLLVISASVLPGMAQNNKNEKDAAKIAAVKELIQSKNYVFRAEYVYPLNNNVQQLLSLQGGSGSQRYLSSQYDLNIGPDTVVAYLPYFGVAYFNTGYNNNPSDAGIQFTSTKFDYSVAGKKNGGFAVTIKPKDAKNTSQMYLYISATGYADLSVLSTNRQSIRFTGYIEEKEKPKS